MLELRRRETSGRLATNSQRPYIDWLRATGPKTYRYDFPHVLAICEALESVFRGECDRLLVCMPPRHFKTETSTVPAPVYCMSRHPGENFLVTGYNERFAHRLGRKTRNWAKQAGLPLDDSKQAADEWAAASGGVLMARGVGSPPTGVGFKGIFIDDPVRRREDADSEVWRENTWDWYTDDLYTRLEPDGFVVLTMTLWHEDDLGARAVMSEPDRWRVLKLPALAEDGDPLGREPGEALCPERYDRDALLRIKEVMTGEDGARSFEALYQQNPSPREGAFFKVARLNFCDELPGGMKSARSWDIGDSTNGDPTAGVKVAGPDKDGFFYVVHAEHGRWESAERDSVMRFTRQSDGPSVRVTVPQDPGAAGKSLARHFVTMLSGSRVTPVLPTGDKETRADPFAGQVNAGNVYVVRGDWDWRGYVEELRQFPHGAHDDRVDASADAFNHLTTFGAAIGNKQRQATGWA